MQENIGSDARGVAGLAASPALAPTMPFRLHGGSYFCALPERSHL